MATINSKRVILSIIWDKANPEDLLWSVNTSAYVDDDTEGQGEKVLQVGTPEQTITRSQFRGLTGQQIENTVKSKAADQLNEIGSGAGSHTINDDTGN